MYAVARAAVLTLLCAGGCEALNDFGLFTEFFGRERTLESVHYQEAEGTLLPTSASVAYVSSGGRA
jgi:hypothetical protein